MTPLELAIDDDATIAAISLDAQLCGADSVSDMDCEAIERILSDWEHTSAATADCIEHYQHDDGDAMSVAPPPPTAINQQPHTAGAAAAVDAFTPTEQLSSLVGDTAPLVPEQQHQHQQQQQSSRAGKRPLRPRATNTSRARQLREMQTLREQIAALTDALAHSQQQQRQQTASWTSVTTPHLQSQELLSLQVTASRQHCETERERLKRARREHQQLRRSVRDQMRLFERLERAVRKRTARAAELVAEQLQWPLRRHRNDAPSRHVSTALTPDDQRIFAQTVADIAAMYASADRELTVLLQQTERLALAPLDSSDGSGARAWHVLCDAAHAPAAPTRVEMVACEEVPFCKAAVDHCLRLARWQKRPVERLYGAEHYSGLTDVVVTKERVCFGASDSVAHLASHAFVDQERSVYVGVAYVCPAEDEDGDEDAVDGDRTIPRGCVLRAQSWIVLTPRERSTLVHTFASMTPVAAYSLRASAVTQAAAAGGRGDAAKRTMVMPCVFAPGSEHRVLSEWTRIHATRQQCLENLLLDHQATV